MDLKQIIVDHINAIGPQTSHELLEWVKSQLSDNPQSLIDSTESDSLIYKYIEDGTTFYTTESQDPR